MLSHEQTNLAPEKTMTFIRAPYIASIGPKAEILAQVDGHITAARQNRQLVTAFQPELSEDVSVHQYFLENIVEGSRKSA